MSRPHSPDRAPGSEPMDGQTRTTEGQGDGYEAPPTRWRIDPRGSKAAPAQRPADPCLPHKLWPERRNNAVPTDWATQPKGAYYGEDQMRRT